MKNSKIHKIYRNSKGQLHREDGPAIEYVSGYKAWFLNGQRHRTDGPAIEYANGDKEWYLNGKLHRTDGPAVEWAAGDISWVINDKELTEEQFNNKLYRSLYLNIL